MPFMTTKSRTRTPSDFSHTQKLPSVTLREKGTHSIFSSMAMDCVVKDTGWAPGNLRSAMVVYE